MYVATHGPDDPTKACMPFHLAVNGAAEAGIEAEVNLAGDAAVLIQDQYVETLTPLGLPPLRRGDQRARLLRRARTEGAPHP
jgi:predicted peroxiredoxin